MNFVKLGNDAYLNLDSVASVTWDGSGEELVATVKFLIPAVTQPSGQAQLAQETFKGEAALALKRLLEPAMNPNRFEAQRAHITPAAQTAPEKMYSAPNESLHMLVSGRTKKKAWFFLRVDDRGYFLAMVNAKGSCSMRTFDAETGRFLGKQYAQGDYQDQFGKFLENAQEVFLSQQPNLENSCREQLPPSVFQSLRGQIQLQ